MNKLFLLLAVVFFLIGSYTILTVYSKVYGKPKVNIYHCTTHSLEDKCIIQNSFNSFLDKILPDKNRELIDKFSPTPFNE